LSLPGERVALKRREQLGCKDDFSMTKDRKSIMSPVRCIFLAAILAMGGTAAANAKLPVIELPGDRAFPESITSTSQGTLYIRSFASGGVLRVRSGQSQAEPWINPGAYDSRSTFGVLADEKSNTLWVCSNDASAFGVPGPSSVKGSFLKGFDLDTGNGKISAALPGARALCNDMALGPDGSVYVTNSFAPQILRLRAGGTQLDVWLTDPQFEPPKDGAGLDGIAFGGDGNIYVNTFTPGEFFRVDVKDGIAGTVTKLKTSRPLSHPDGLRALQGNRFLMIEGEGSLDRVTVADDIVSIETIKDGFLQPTGVTRDGNMAWVSEGQLSRLTGEVPRLPFRVYAVPLSEP
jgi:sugar lactone lactonase YvrE